MLVMYEAFFGLHRRPFGATPDAACFFSLPAVQGILDELVVCVEQGQGIAVVTGPAGAGKSLLCQKLLAELGPEFVPVFVHHGNFETRKALLQTILCALDKPYQRTSDQELRLELEPVLRSLSRDRRSLVILCDEAHELSESLLEELRILTDLSDRGAPLVRLVLCGQPALEETLAMPAMQAFNQRIRAHVHLDLLTRSESWEYVDYRLTWAGGRTGEIFSHEAMEVVVEAADGSPRALNQLCDHTLLLAYVLEQRPVPAESVREALEDLRQLPLHWNVPRQQAAAGVTSATAVWEMDAASDEPAMNSYESGAELAEPAELSEQESAGAGETWEEPSKGGSETRAALAEPVYGEEVVVDRYAALDAGLNPEELFPTAANQADTGAAEEVHLGEESPVRDERVTDLSGSELGELSEHIAGHGSTLEDQVGAEVLGLYRDMRRTLDERAAAFDADDEEFQDVDESDEAADGPRFFSIETDEPVAHVSELDAVSPGERPYRNLFSRLRRKQFEE